MLRWLWFDRFQPAGFGWWRPQVRGIAGSRHLLGDRCGLRSIARLYQRSRAQETLAASPLLELDARLEATTTRLERDYLAASLQSHSLRERLWDSGYDWAIRFADAYRAILMRETASVAGRAATEFARVAARFSGSARWLTASASIAMRWIPGIWAETHQVFLQDLRSWR